MDERRHAMEEAGMAVIMLRVRGMGLPRVMVAWLATEKGIAEVRCHFRRTWRALEAETWKPMKLSPTPAPAEQLIKMVEDVARDLWLRTKK